MNGAHTPDFAAAERAIGYGVRAMASLSRWPRCCDVVDLPGPYAGETMV